MSLTAFRTLGHSGLVVSPLALGTMTLTIGVGRSEEKLLRPKTHRMAACWRAGETPCETLEPSKEPRRLVDRSMTTMLPA